MTLTEWIDRQPELTRGEVYDRLAKESGVSAQTVGNIDRGMRLNTYNRAKALSDATGGKVTIRELCE